MRSVQDFFDLTKYARLAARAEIVFVLAATLIYWTDILRILFPGETGTASAAFRLSHFAIYGVVAALLARKFGRFVEAYQAAPLLMVLLLLPLLSTTWSIDPQESMQRGIAVLGSSIFGIYLATQSSQTRTLGLLAITATTAALLSLFLIVAIPSVGIMQTEEYVGTWKGAYGHKNGFGQMTAIGAVVCALALRQASGWSRSICIAGFSLNLILLAGSRSLTAQMLFVVCFAALLFAARLVRFMADHTGWVSGGGLVVAAVLSLALNVDDGLQLLLWFGKDANLSSRLPMWQNLMPFIGERFWLGYGFDAFWTDDNYAVAIVTQRLHFRPYYGHNGIIELMLGLGAVGTGLFLCVFAVYLRQSFVLLHRAPDNPIYLLSLIFSLVTIIQNVSENTLLQRNAMTWTMFVMLATYLAVASARMRSDVSARDLSVPGVDASSVTLPSIPQRLSVV
jgi:exopolysaccharide production protein ExoQ